MKKILSHIKDNFIKGLIFLLPIIVVLVLVAKAISAMKGFSAKIAALFGMKTIMGVSGTTIISTISIIAICVLAGYFVRLKFMQIFRDRLDKKLGELLPGYETYREMALQKINKEEEKLPYTKAVLLKENNYEVPGFLMDQFRDGRLTIFVPNAGNPQEGQIRIVPPEEVTILQYAEVKKVHTSVHKLGANLGLAIG
jgi:uncharacterized membrane protein